MIDAIDKSILKMLQKDSKQTIKVIANRLNLSATPVFERIKRLEKEGYITSYRAVINRKQVGLNLLVLCNVSLNQHEASFIAKFERDIQQLDEVIECYHIGGMFDYLLKVVASDMDSYQHFVAKKLASLDNIRQVQSAFVMAEVKSTANLPIV
ncbi:MAG: Lrp/AsnC family transcriptional regulator [Flavobacteriaceae bacterium]|nr:Lrp/AsnC family transcriptional regulator [Flavobacteriaceae bacterium]